MGDPIRFLLQHMRRLEWPALAVTILLFAVGLWCIDRAVLIGPDSWLGSYAGRQLFFGAAGLALLGACLFPHYRFFERIAYPLYGGVVLLLVVTAFAGVLKNNARRWIDLGPFLLQPSEPMKVALVLALARTLRRPRGRRWPALLQAVGLTALAAGLVARQPDLGTALLYVPVLFVLLFLSGYSLRLLAGLALAGGGLLVLVAAFGLRDYQWDRLRTFLAPSSVQRTGRGYHRFGSLLAIGSGRGIGTRDPEQLFATLRGLPERRTDFVFSVLGASAGLAGCAAVLAGYALLVILLLRIGTRTREPFGRLLAGGVAMLLGVQVLVNVAMTLGLAPITGLTLPFMSYGGSSLVTSFVALGLALNVGMRPGRTLARGDFS